MSASIDAGLESIPHHEIQAGQTIKVFVKSHVFDEKGFPKWIELEVTVLRVFFRRNKAYIRFTYPGCGKSNGRVCEGFCRKVSCRVDEIPSYGLLRRILMIFCKSPLRQRQIVYH